MLTRQKLANAHPQQVREIIAKQEYIEPTNGVCNGYLQANVVILHRRHARGLEIRTFVHLQLSPLGSHHMLRPLQWKQISKDSAN